MAWITARACEGWGGCETGWRAWFQKQYSAAASPLAPPIQNTKQGCALARGPRACIAPAAPLLTPDKLTRLSSWPILGSAMQELGGHDDHHADGPTHSSSAACP